MSSWSILDDYQAISAIANTKKDQLVKVAMKLGKWKVGMKKKEMVQFLREEFTRAKEAKERVIVKPVIRRKTLFDEEGKEIPESKSSLCQKAYYVRNCEKLRELCRARYHLKKKGEASPQGETEPPSSPPEIPQGKTESLPHDSPVLAA